MQEKLTLNQTWKYCLAMWKWIAKKAEQDSELNVDDLKSEWLKKHPRFGKVYNDCFFCEYLEQHPTTDDESCPTCPGRLVSKRFNCMDNVTYNFSYKPIKFYQKLVELNEKRKSK